mmetsp:Transcript_4876/g.4637  ORF Transcript_4876/g.4637 Transcript_4876/m.4637 type:complete len:192 (-) Transcript_4876:592-1167(-)|eukprot:CAMPEP_0197005624 /NCGR_PEP_ID=MMETSP1380-20130617/30367_1 /TAXON_ID=5936 /ORGANISM="Euplotes crassus, Strain CT5" /LENGTH=191 /DNA_ID=CAMNT_0042424825 /DNA_START=93 /DNA_END=668 /DNA_ORIENTATION=+
MLMDQEVETGPEFFSLFRDWQKLANELSLQGSKRCLIFENFYQTLKKGPTLMNALSETSNETKTQMKKRDRKAIEKSKEKTEEGELPPVSSSKSPSGSHKRKNTEESENSKSAPIQTFKANDAEDGSITSSLPDPPLPSTSPCLFSPSCSPAQLPSPPEKDSSLAPLKEAFCSKPSAKMVVKHKCGFCKED